jgi:hypothetical protein
MPADVPPRPGAPGYGEFIAHGQAAPEVKQQPPAAAVQGTFQPGAATPAAASAPAASAPPAAPVRGAVPDSDVTQDSSVVNGGLY